MLLTNTTQANTININVINGNVICGVALRGCSVCPEHFAEQPTQKRRAKRIAPAAVRHATESIDAMCSGDYLTGHQPWLSSPSSQLSGLRLLLGSGSGRSLS